jgi:hypothetical protein
MCALTQHASIVQELLLYLNSQHSCTALGTVPEKILLIKKQSVFNNMDSKEIEHLREVYNEKYQDDIPAGSPEEVWRQILQKFASKCNTGRSECIVAHMMNRPKAPDSWISNPEDWLSDQDINKFEKQLEKLFKDYKFLGCVSIDFNLKSKTGQCIVDALCATNLRDLYKKGKTKIGIVFNTDVHDGPGEHWMAVYCDISPHIQPRITYFDSYAFKPEPEIQRLMKRWSQEWDATGIHDTPMETTYNTTKHQYKNTECGMYSIYFHYCCLNEITMDERIPDDVMNVFRNVLFRT